MVRLLALAAAVLAAFNPTDATFVVNFPKGVYYRPMGFEVSGRENATTLYLRSPCPALNSMANHGFLPRDGKKITPALLKAAVMEYFNIDNNLADIMISLGPRDPEFTLATLAKHNLIEHDVSLTRRDSCFGGDQSLADNLLLHDILNSGLLTGQVSVKDLAKIRESRRQECVAKNPNCNYGDQQQFIANAESGLLLRGLGGKNTEFISYAYIFAFLVNEQFPAGFTKPTQPITFADLAVTIANLKAVAV